MAVSCVTHFFNRPVDRSSFRQAAGISLRTAAIGTLALDFGRRVFENGILSRGAASYLGFLALPGLYLAYSTRSMMQVSFSEVKPDHPRVQNMARAMALISLVATGVLTGFAGAIFFSGARALMDGVQMKAALTICLGIQFLTGSLGYLIPNAKTLWEKHVFDYDRYSQEVCQYLATGIRHFQSLPGKCKAYFDPPLGTIWKVSGTISKTCELLMRKKIDVHFFYWLRILNEERIRHTQFDLLLKMEAYDGCFDLVKEFPYLFPADFLKNSMQSSDYFILRLLDEQIKDYEKNESKKQKILLLQQIVNFWDGFELSPQMCEKFPHVAAKLDLWRKNRNHINQLAIDSVSIGLSMEREACHEISAEEINYLKSSGASIFHTLTIYGFCSRHFQALRDGFGLDKEELLFEGLYREFSARGLLEAGALEEKGILESPLTADLIVRRLCGVKKIESEQTSSWEEASLVNKVFHTIFCGCLLGIQALAEPIPTAVGFSYGLLQDFYSRLPTPPFWPAVSNLRPLYEPPASGYFHQGFTHSMKILNNRVFSLTHHLLFFEGPLHKISPLGGFLAGAQHAKALIKLIKKDENQEIR